MLLRRKIWNNFTKNGKNDKIEWNPIFFQNKERAQSLVYGKGGRRYGMDFVSRGHCFVWFCFSLISQKQ